MLALALQGLRGRKGPFIGAAVALAVAAALVMACATLLQAGLQSKPPVERYAGAIVVTGDQNAHFNVGTENADSTPLYERVRIPANLADAVAQVPGVGAVAADTGVDATVLGPRGIVPGPGGHATELHPWSTAALTPFRLTG